MIGDDVAASAPHKTVITTTASHTDVREATQPVEGEQQKPRNQRGDCGKPHKGQLSVAAGQRWHHRGTE
jgi:hypothetical protein